MKVERTTEAQTGRTSVIVRDDRGERVEPVCAFLTYLNAQGYSPNTLRAYAHDALYLLRFLAGNGLTLADMTPQSGITFLAYLRAVRVQRRRRFSYISNPPAELAPATINRILAFTASLYDYLSISGVYERENPLHKQYDAAQARVPEAHRPYMGHASRQRPVRRTLRVKMATRLPRPLDQTTLEAITRELRTRRDKAIVLLMLEGGLRPGEVINLRVKDVQYSRRRVIIRFYEDHPKGVRTKSRKERVVDLYEGYALQALRAYMILERPSDTGSAYVFLVGRRGRHRADPIGYHAVQRMFKRACVRAGITDITATLHALRHTHATRMWDGGMRELTLQKRLGHASPESTKLYTRVSDRTVSDEYNRAIGKGAAS